MPRNEGELVDAGGRQVRVTNLDKVLYPETGTTKADVMDYFARIAPVLLPHAANRPATRKRWVHGVGTTEAPGEMFFQKNLDASTPSWVKRRTIEHKDHSNEYPMVNDLATLTWLAQIAALEIHVPQWQFGRTGVQKNPDRLVLDLDPGQGVGLQECAEVARLARVILQGMGLEPFPVTSGSKGIHLYAALDGRSTSDEVSAITHELARALEADNPDLVVSDMKRSLRDGKVLVDWSQNSGNKTTITPYSLRGRARPMVAAPRSWRELSRADLAQLDYTEVLARVARRGDPLAELTAGHLASLEPTAERMASFAAAPEHDRLATYRSKRDATKTPEPVPEKHDAAATGQSFVIQEHHARNLHWDFRLEREGVLVSWALPKGMPTDPANNHLAVQTEDHPLEYGAFEGSIPPGEYGAGDVTIWDAGGYELEKWRDGEEIIVTLNGERHGSHRYALIHTGSGGGKAANNWLIHLMKDGTASAPTVHKRKVVTGSGKRPSVSPAAPMLATSGRLDPGEAADWVFEMKWDGVRAILQVADGAVTVFSRNGIDVTAGYPELAALSESIAADAILDGEIVALDRQGRPSFSRLQERMKLNKPDEVQAARRSTAVHLMLFDALELDGRSLLRSTWTERRAALEAAVTAAGNIHLPPVFDGALDAALASSAELGLEGVVAKRRESTYQRGKRSQSWVKVKLHRAQEVVIGGWRPGSGNRAGRVGSLLLGIPEGESLRYVGRVGTGFSDRQLDEFARRFRSLERVRSPFAELPAVDARGAHYLRPSLVGEVEFAEWTPTGRLRHPSWRGWRSDKEATEVTLEP